MAFLRFVFYNDCWSDGLFVALEFPLRTIHGSVLYSSCVTRFHWNDFVFLCFLHIVFVRIVKLKARWNHVDVAIVDIEAVSWAAWTRQFFITVLVPTKHQTYFIYRKLHWREKCWCSDSVSACVSISVYYLTRSPFPSSLGVRERMRSKKVFWMWSGKLFIHGLYFGLNLKALTSEAVILKINPYLYVLLNPNQLSAVIHEFPVCVDAECVVHQWACVDRCIYPHRSSWVELVQVWVDVETTWFSNAVITKPGLLHKLLRKQRSHREIIERESARNACNEFNK